ncbi:disulfide bond formation protein B [Streptomyces boninensis]|uniref:disulfide bond formation protein B n=1 Tax=Streptomyces boninensis TaxID=2039455 RepID=UPI003B21158E
MSVPRIGLRGLLGQAQWWLAVVFVIGWTGVVCGGLLIQFGEWEYPCPLCMIQRMFMLLAALGAAFIVRQGMTGQITRRDYLMGWGMALVACLGGSFAAWRQTMLHILPHAKGYGGTALGLHLYVWAWILFNAAIAAIALLMVFANVTADRTIPAGRGHRTVGLLALGFCGLVIAINMFAVFFQEGFHWFLPDDPTRYEFFYDTGIIG